MKCTFRSVDNLIRKFNKNVQPRCQAKPEVKLPIASTQEKVVHHYDIVDFKVTAPLADFALSQLVHISKEPDPICRGYRFGPHPHGNVTAKVTLSSDHMISILIVTAKVTFYQII